MLHVELTHLFFRYIFMKNILISFYLGCAGFIISGHMACAKSAAVKVDLASGIAALQNSLKGAIARDAQNNNKKSIKKEAIKDWSLNDFNDTLTLKKNNKLLDRGPTRDEFRIIMNGLMNFVQYATEDDYKKVANTWLNTFYEYEDRKTDANHQKERHMFAYMALLMAARVHHEQKLSYSLKPQDVNALNEAQKNDNTKTINETTKNIRTMRNSFTQEVKRRLLKLDIFDDKKNTLEDYLTKLFTKYDILSEHNLFYKPAQNALARFMAQRRAAKRSDTLADKLQSVDDIIKSEEGKSIQVMTSKQSDPDYKQLMQNAQALEREAKNMFDKIMLAIKNKNPQFYNALIDVMKDKKTYIEKLKIININIENGLGIIKKLFQNIDKLDDKKIRYFLKKNELLLTQGDNRTVEIKKFGSASGAATEAIYGVFVTPAKSTLNPNPKETLLYVVKKPPLKEIESEVRNVFYAGELIKHLPLARPLSKNFNYNPQTIYTSHNFEDRDGWPQLKLHEKIILEKNDAGETQNCFMILHGARGVDWEAYMKPFTQKIQNNQKFTQEEKATLLTHAFAMGRTVGLMEARFVKGDWNKIESLYTISFLDNHRNNIFFDTNTNLFRWIDLASLGKSAYEYYNKDSQPSKKFPYDGETLNTLHDGKTLLMEGLQQLIAKGVVMSALRDYKVDLRENPPKKTLTPRQKAYINAIAQAMKKGYYSAFSPEQQKQLDQQFARDTFTKEYLDKLK